MASVVAAGTSPMQAPDAIETRTESTPKAVAL